MARPPPAVLALLLGVAAAGCRPAAPGALARADASARIGAARRIAVAVDVRAREVSEGLSYEVGDDDAPLRARVSATLTAALAAEGLAGVPAGPEGDPELREVLLLFEAVAQDAPRLREVAPPEDGLRPFAYGLGPVGALLDRAGADLLLVSVARSTRAAPPGAGACATDAALLAVALVDREGSVVWLRELRRRCADPLADDAQAAAFAREALAGLGGGAP